jgi:hypothetical protein
MSTNQSKPNPVPAGFVPNKALGQNFLSSDTIIEAILDAAQIESQRVLEFGPVPARATKDLFPRLDFLAGWKGRSPLRMLTDDLVRSMRSCGGSVDAISARCGV